MGGFALLIFLITIVQNLCKAKQKRTHKEKLTDFHEDPDYGRRSRKSRRIMLSEES